MPHIKLKLISYAIFTMYIQPSGVNLLFMKSWTCATCHMKTTNVYKYCTYAIWKATISWKWNKKRFAKTICGFEFVFSFLIHLYIYDVVAAIAFCLCLTTHISQFASCIRRLKIIFYSSSIQVYIRLDLEIKNCRISCIDSQNIVPSLISNHTSVPISGHQIDFDQYFF